MNKWIWIIVLVLIVGGGYYFYSLKGQRGESQVPSAENTMPVPSVSAVQEKTAEPEASATKSFTLDGFEFGFDKKTLTVKKGDKVSITLTNSGKMPHNWIIDEFNAKTKTIQNGDTDTITFVADRTGTFEYYCGIGQHRAMGMVGKLIVEE